MFADVHCCVQAQDALALAANRTWMEASPGMSNCGAFDMDTVDSSDDNAYHDSKDDTMDENLLG